MGLEGAEIAHIGQGQGVARFSILPHLHPPGALCRAHLDPARLPRPSLRAHPRTRHRRHQGRGQNGHEGQPDQGSTVQVQDVHMRGVRV
jgi:hypothetical protein